MLWFQLALLKSAVCSADAQEQVSATSPAVGAADAAVSITLAIPAPRAEEHASAPSRQACAGARQASPAEGKQTADLTTLFGPAKKGAGPLMEAVLSDAVSIIADTGIGRQP